MADRLVAWLHGTPVAELARAADYRITLEWRAEALERWGGGSRVLSVGLPLGLAMGRRDNRGLDFFENILPEGGGQRATPEAGHPPPRAACLAVLSSQHLPLAQHGQSLAPP